MSKPVLHVALIGAGMRPHQIFNGLLTIPGVELTVVYDLNREQIDARLAEWHVSPRIAPDAMSAINDPAVDLVAVFSPNSSVTPNTSSPRSPPANMCSAKKRWSLRWKIVSASSTPTANPANTSPPVSSFATPRSIAKSRS